MEDIVLYYILVYVTGFFGLFTSIFFLITLLEFRKKIKDPGIDLDDPKLPLVSLILTAFNEEKNIGKTIKSIQELNYPKDKIEILIIDDGSQDNTLRESKKLALKDRRIRVFTKENGGVASARNIGIKHAKGEFIVTFDVDSFPAPDCLKNMLGYFRDKRVMCVTPSMTVYKPKGFLQNLQYVEYTFGIFLRKVFGLLNCIHVTPGPFSIFRKSFFSKHGLFDEKNITEDIDIALRIQKAGYKIENSINAPVYTVAPNKFVALLKQRMRWYYGFTTNVLKNKDIFKPKYGYLALLLIPSAFISVALTILVFIYFFYKNISFLIDNIIRARVVGSDLFSIDLKTIKLSYVYDVLSNFIMNPFIMLMIIALILTLTSILIGKRGVKDNKNIAWPFIYFSFTYWFFYAIWWVAPFVYKLFGGKFKWGLQTY